jgi:bifunctional DNA-binding transcriptional regulator/antitoxin component of YhaV-PrlF toxin-antitoxin module
MNTPQASVKLTSKHQFTVPADVMRQLKLATGDRLTYKVQDGAIVLKPRPTIAQQLEKMWAENVKINKGVASDTSIKQSVRDYYRNKKVL